MARDIELFGGSSTWQAVRGKVEDERTWLTEAPVCTYLNNHQIAHAGKMWAKPPFKVIRSEASGTFILVGLRGEGETLIDGNWQVVKPGEVCLLPAFAHTGIRASQSKTWEFAWVRYQEARERVPVLSADSPVIHEGPVDSLAHAIGGLYAELQQPHPNSSPLHHWVELIHGFVLRAARPYELDDRLWRIWEEVDRDLARNWRLSELAQIGHLSGEHLRRLCKQQLGRSPVQQVTHLRMRKAVELLTRTTEKVETIAHEVGYESPFTFSNAFKRWTGRRPSDYRS